LFLSSVLLSLFLLLLLFFLLHSFHSVAGGLPCLYLSNAKSL
jgi:hypothetical protein